MMQLLGDFVMSHGLGRMAEPSLDMVMEKLTTGFRQWETYIRTVADALDRGDCTSQEAVGRLRELADAMREVADYGEAQR